MRYLYLSILLLATVANAQFDNIGYVGKLNRASGYSTTLADGLVAYWGFENNGNDSFSTKNLSAVNTIYYTNDCKLGSYSVTNTQDAYFTIASNSFTGTAFSFSIWAKRTGTSGSFSLAGQYAAGNLKWRLRDTAGANTMDVRWSDDGTGTTANNISVVSGQWEHIVIAVSTSNIKAYTNGAIAWTITTRIPIADAASDLWIGRTQDSAGQFRGMFDDAAFWNRQLTADEVTLLWNSGNGRPLNQF